MSKLLILFVIAVAGFSQAQTPAEPVDPKQLAVIEGSVFNSFTGQALKKVTIALRPNMMGRTNSAPIAPPSSYIATTNTEGKFIIEKVDPGTYLLSAEAQGFVRQMYSPRQASTAGAPITLAAGQHAKEYTFKLLPHAIITGHVYDEDGDPISRARIAVLRTIRNRGVKQLAPVGGAETNDLGEFRVFSLPPGKYFLSATLLSRMQMGFGGPTRNPPAEEYIPTYFPASTDETGARQIELAGGQTFTGADVRMKRTRVFHIRGKVLQAGAPARNVRIAVAPRDRPNNMGMMFSSDGGVAADGSFDLAGHPPGSYNLYAFQSSQGPMRTVGRATVELDREDANGVTIAIVDNLQVRGRIRVDGDLEELERTSGRKFSYSSIMLQFTSAAGMNFSAMRAMTSEDGNFVLENASPEVLNLNAFGLPQGLWLKAATAGDRDILERGLDLTAGSPSNPVEVVIGIGVGTISGTAVDGKQLPLPAATVTLLPEPFNEQRFDLFKMAVTDERGAFTVANISPGTYKVYAWENYDGSNANDPEMLKAVASSARLITVKANSNENVTLSAIPFTQTK